MHTSRHTGTDGETVSSLKRVREPHPASWQSSKPMQGGRGREATPHLGEKRRWLCTLLTPALSFLGSWDRRLLFGGLHWHWCWNKHSPQALSVAAAGVTLPVTCQHEGCPLTQRAGRPTGMMVHVWKSSCINYDNLVIQRVTSMTKHNYDRPQ